MYLFIYLLIYLFTYLLRNSLVRIFLDSYPWFIIFDIGIDIRSGHSSKEVWKLNFRQSGEMEMAQPGRNSDMEKVRREKIRDGEDQR